jgi:hypothetical protein
LKRSLNAVAVANVDALVAEFHVHLVVLWHLYLLGRKERDFCVVVLGFVLSCVAALAAFTIVTGCHEPTLCAGLLTVTFCFDLVKTNLLTLKLPRRVLTEITVLYVLVSNVGDVKVDGALLLNIEDVTLFWDVANIDTSITRNMYHLIMISSFSVADLFSDYSC